MRLPRISNSTDIEALACEPGVLVRWITDPADLADADVVVIPGSKSTVSDLTWLRERRLVDGIAAHAGAGKPLLGICGGFQMLCRRIDDNVESRAGDVAGLGLLDADIAFAAEKTLQRWETPLSGYEIHHGVLGRYADDEWLGGGVPVGIRRGYVYGTHWHGLLDNDDFRRQWLAEVAAAAGRTAFVGADDIDVAARRDAQFDVMADLLTSHVDVDALLGLLEHGPPTRPTITSRLDP